MSRVDSAMRDHLANERTLLAWVRTSLAFMAFGIAVEKFAVFLRLTAMEATGSSGGWNPLSARLLCLLLIGFGGALSLAGAFRTQRWSRNAATLDGAPPVWPLTAVALTTCVVALILALHVMLSTY